MKTRFSTFKPNIAQALVLGLGALTGACHKQATHSPPPESAPTATTLDSSTTHEGRTRDDNTPSVASATDGVSPQTPTVTGAQGKWPSAVSATGGSSGSSTFQGCLSKPAQAQNNPTRSSRAATPETFTVTPLGNGALVTHRFPHACCLSATTETTVAANTINVQERLTGTPCRCVCDSTIQTRVNVPPGDYDVRLTLNTNGAEAQVGVHPLAVKKTIVRSAAP
jgi:hypothetical protein